MKDVETMHPEELPASHAYRLLEPGPIVLLTTAAADGPNIMTMGFHMMVQHDPPLIACVVGPWDFSFKALSENGECVLAIPTVDLARTVVDIGNCSGEEIDKFQRFGLTPLPASKVAPPLIAECVTNIECTVTDQRLVADYNLFILRAECIWMDSRRKEKRTLHHRGDGSFFADGEVVDHSQRMTKWRDLPLPG